MGPTDDRRAQMKFRLPKYRLKPGQKPQSASDEAIAAAFPGLRLRSSLLVVLVGDAVLALVVAGLVSQHSVFRMVSILLAIVLPLLLFIWSSPESLRLVQADRSTHRLRSMLTFCSSVAAAALFAVSLGFSRSIPNQADRAVRSSLGPVDLMVLAPDANTMEQARVVVAQVRSQESTAGLIDADPITMGVVDAAVLTESSPVRVRLLEVSPTLLDGFSGQFETKVPLQVGEVIIAAPSAKRLGGKVGEPLRIRTVGQIDLSLTVVATPPAQGILGLPEVDGSSTVNVFVAPGTLASVPTGDIKQIMLLSLCGISTEKVIEGGVRKTCSSDPIESAAYVARVDDELSKMFATLVPLVDDDALFADVAEASGPAATSVNLSILPVKKLAVDGGTHDSVVARRVLDLAALPLSVAAIVGLAASALFQRTSRTRVERILGLGPGRAVGDQTLLAVGDHLPGSILGTALGVVMVRVAVALSSEQRSVLSPSTLVNLLCDGIAMSAGVTIGTSLIQAVVAQRISLGAIMSGRIQRATWWKSVGIMLLIVSAMALALGSDPTLLVTATFVLLFGGFALLSSFGFGSLVTRRVFATGAAALVLLVTVVLSWLVSHRRDDAGLLSDHRWPLATIASSLIALVMAWVLFARTTEVGRTLAQWFLPSSDQPMLSVLRSRSAKRVGPWALAGLVSCSFAIGATAPLGSILAASAAETAAPATSSIVEVNDVYSNAISDPPAIPLSISALTFSAPVANVSGVLAPTTPLSDKSLGLSSSRPVSVSRVDDASLLTLLPLLNPEAITLADSETLVNRSAFRRVFGVEPNLGDTVTLVGSLGQSVPVRVTALFDGSLQGAVWINERTWARIGPSTPFGRRLVVPPASSSVSTVRSGLEASLRGQAVSLSPDPTRRTDAGHDAGRISRILRWISAPLSALLLCALMFRWALSRRAELQSIQGTTLSDAIITRSISRDLAGHAVGSTLVGLVAGLALSASFLPFAAIDHPSSVIAIPWLQLLAMLVAPALLSVFVARLRTIPKASDEVRSQNSKRLTDGGFERSQHSN